MTFTTNAGNVDNDDVCCTNCLDVVAAEDANNISLHVVHCTCIVNLNLFAKSPI